MQTAIPPCKVASLHLFVIILEMFLLAMRGRKLGKAERIAKGLRKLIIKAADY